MGTFLVLCILAIAVGAVIGKLVQDRKAGKHLCGGDCSSCHGCSHSVGCGKK